jgi:hypothetical protein
LIPVVVFGNMVWVVRKAVKEEMINEKPEMSRRGARGEG